MFINWLLLFVPFMLCEEVVAAPIIVAGTNLNQESWFKVLSGKWLIELYS